MYPYFVAIVPEGNVIDDPLKSPPFLDPVYGRKVLDPQLPAANQSCFSCGYFQHAMQASDCCPLPLTAHVLRQDVVPFQEGFTVGMSIVAYPGPGCRSYRRTMDERGERYGERSTP